MIQVIFFDMNGVICIDKFKEGLSMFGLPLGLHADEMYKIVHDHDGWKKFTLGLISETDFLDQCEKRMSGMKLDRLKFCEMIDATIVPSDLMIQLIRDLSLKYKIGIISNSPKEWFERFIQKTGLSGLVAIQAVSGFLHIRKPSVDIFKMALELAKIQPSKAVYVDDRSEMLIEATELGMKTIIFDGNIENLRNNINNL